MRHNHQITHVVVTVTCNKCQQPFEFILNASAYLDWMNGKHVQFAFPEIPSSKRELLISGFCPACWEDMFAPPQIDEAQILSKGRIIHNEIEGDES